MCRRLSPSFMSIPHSFHSCGRLWKTPVEKPVENVENSQLSTGILPFSNDAAGCGKHGLSGFHNTEFFRHPGCYVTVSSEKIPAERRIKCWNSVNFNCQSPGCPRLEREFFVEIQQILFPYQMSSTGNTFVVGLTPESSRGGLWQPSHSQEDSICRER